MRSKTILIIWSAIALLFCIQESFKFEDVLGFLYVNKLYLRGIKVVVLKKGVTAFLNF